MAAFISYIIFNVIYLYIIAALDAERDQKHAEEIERLLKEKEMEMEEEFKDRIESEMEYLKDRFEYILQ